MSNFQTTPAPIRNCSKGDVSLVWNVLRGKAFATIPDSTVAIKIDVLTLSGLQQIELNRFDAATRGVIWEEQAPNKDQRKVVNQYLKFLSKMWEHEKMEASKSGGPMPTILTKDPHRQTGQHPQNLIPIQLVPILSKNMPMPQVGPSRPNHQMPSAPIPWPRQCPLGSPHPCRTTQRTNSPSFIPGNHTGLCPRSCT